MKQHTPLPVLMQRTVAQFMPFGNTKQSFSKESVEKASRIRDAQKVHSVCPYCAVGCSLNVYVKDGKVIDIEGDPESPINHERVKKTRDETFVERLQDGREVNHTLGIASLGGATLDIEENYLMKKLLTGGLGIVSIENQARI